MGSKSNNFPARKASGQPGTTFTRSRAQNHQGQAGARPVGPEHFRKASDSAVTRKSMNPSDARSPRFDDRGHDSLGKEY